ncbi:methylmalonyl-CoA mutase family protein [Myroides fluvii]|uniref:methylmalonyl-CoA mutase family protein n=1 Tax=Myroides fluvii TaxID=2572594 RepID=UPI00131B756B|nr:methylmalonyl-CoA mutase family protein [Myroides fluvii]
MKRKDVQHLNLNSTSFNTASTPSVSTTIEGMVIQQKYEKEDIEALDAVDFAAGFAPYVRGISPLMYVQQPWEIQLLPATNQLEAGNISYRKQIALGQKHLLFDLSPSTSAGGFSIHTVEDVKILIDQLPLAEITATIRTNEALLPLLAMYIVAAQEQGIDTKFLRGNLQYDAFDFAPNTITPLHKAILDSLDYTYQHMPHFKVLSLSNHHLKKKKLSADQEIAYSLAQGLTYIKSGVSEKIPIDYIASQVTFSWYTGVNYFMEIAKMRATRWLWSRLVHSFHPKSEQSLALTIQTQTERWGADTKDDLTRVTTASTTAVFGGTQALAIAFDHTAYGEHTALQLHQFMQEEMKATKTVDPWAGSYYVEHTTLALAEKAWNILEEICPTDDLVAISLQKEHETQQQQNGDTTAFFPDTMQKERQAVIKVERDTQKVEWALTQLTQGVSNPTHNLLALAIEAVKVRATTEEIQRALFSNPS